MTRTNHDAAMRKASARLGPATWIVLITALVGFLGLAGPWLIRQLEIDRCYDRGGCWEHAEKRCSFDEPCLPTP